MNSKRRKLIAISLSLAFVFATVAVLSFVLIRRENPEWEVDYDLKRWSFRAYENRQKVDVYGVGAIFRPTGFWFIEHQKGYLFGPLHIHRVESSLQPKPLGTNDVHAGDFLYQPDGVPLGRVIEVERWYEFPDGRIDWGILISRKGVPGSGGEEWVSRDKIRSSASDIQPGKIRGLLPKTKGPIVFPEMRGPVRFHCLDSLPGC